MNERPHVWRERYTSARATPELVGRTEILQRIETAIGDRSQAYLVYITGGGGLGKTRLVKHLLEHPPDLPNLAVAEEVIDLYHTRVHSLAGFIGAVLDVLPPLAAAFQTALQEAGADKLALVERAEREGFTLAEVVGQRRELTNFFLDVFNRLSAQQRVVLALDTAERLDVADPTPAYLGLEDEHPFILDWLVREFLPAVQNTVVVVAGRPGTGRVRALLEQVPGKAFLPVELTGFTEEETLQYFDAVAAQARQLGDTHTAETVERLDESQRRTIFYALCDEQNGALTVRPILLALAIDHLTISEQVLDAFRLPLERAKALSPDQREQVRRDLNRAIFAAVREEYRPADDLILHLALLPKGATVELLAEISERSLDEAQKAFEEIKHLSFIKVRPDDERLFLHDEMYALLRRALEDQLPVHRERVLQTVIQHYHQYIRQLQNRMTALYLELTQEHVPEERRPELMREIGHTRALLQDALVEDLYYTLEHDPRLGFQKYYRYAEGAIAAYDDSLDMQLRAELWGFLVTRDQDVINGLDRAEVEADAAVRWVKRLMARRDYEKVARVIERLRQQAPQRLPDVLAQADLDVWEGLMRAERDEYDSAKALLNAAIDRLEQELRARRTQPNLAVRTAGILARAYNNLGYVYRLEGRYHGANRAYERALPLWRFTKIEVEQANTLNNRAFVLAKIGAFDAAWHLGWDAFELRQRLGPRVPVGLSLNTLALIKIEENDLEGARPFAQRALELFADLNSRYGQGLALLALAEMNRRISDWVPYLPLRTATLLEKAVQHAEEAVHIFREEEPEADRLIEALIEVGCDYRDWAKWRRDHPELLAEGEKERERPWSMEELADRSRQALEEAAELARQRGLLYRQVDALVNLAWLRYYTELYVNAPRFEESLEQVEQEVFSPISTLIPAAYLITECKVGPFGQTEGGLPNLNPESTLVPLISELGKLELLRGQIAFNRFERTQRQNRDLLRQAVRHYTLSLAYDTLFSPQIFRDMRRAMGRIYERLRTLNISELRLVYETVEETEQRYGLGESRMRRFLHERFGPPDLLLGAIIL